MARPNHPTPKELERSAVDRCLAALDDALARCRTENMSSAAMDAVLGYLERRAANG